MALKNSQYDQLMREYSRRRFAHLHELEEKERKLFAAYPRLQELSSAVQTASATLAKSRLLGQTKEETDRLRARREELRVLRDNYLVEIGFPSDYLELEYTCPDCKDTGYIGHKKCHCFRQAGIDLLYSQSHLKQTLETENFKNFSLDYYSKDINPKLGISNYEHMHQVARECYNYAANFTPGCGNLLFTGTTGVGKTFLTNCVAKEVLDRSYSVMSISSVELFEKFSYKRQEEEEEESGSRYIMECDLLIIDDLGTELVTSFTASRFFHCINERLLNHKSTVISTNVAVNDLRSVYSERIASRIISSYKIYPLYGEDIRIIKKFKSTQ